MSNAEDESDGPEFPASEADYKKLEKLVAKIQQDLAPYAKVSHNVKLQGKSGAQRQIDVLVEDRVGQYDIRIVIDCKDYKTPIDIKGVEECAGLFEDVGAQRGVIVAPSGFTKNAKARAQALQIDLYRPVDTEDHKWRARVTMPTLCDLRSAAISFGISVSAPFPFELADDYISSAKVTDAATGDDLGTFMKIVADRWNSGGYPTEPGIYEHVPASPTAVKMDNGHGMQIPVDLTVGLSVTRQLFYGQHPIKKISGFSDVLKDDTIIANAFTANILDIEEIEQWRRLNAPEEAPVRPVMTLSGLYAWSPDTKLSLNPYLRGGV